MPIADPVQLKRMENFKMEDLSSGKEGDYILVKGGQKFPQRFKI